MEILKLLYTCLDGVISSDQSHESDCICIGIPTFIQLLIVFSVALIIVAVATALHQLNFKCQKLIPNIKVDSSGKVIKLEKFPHYVARQLGFADRRSCPNLGELASDYINKREGCEDHIYAYFSQEPDGDSLFIKLLEEFERCILSYFAFHWSFADIALTQVIYKMLPIIKGWYKFQVLLGPEPGPRKKLKNILLAASRPFWQEASGQAVVIEADAFKESDVIYRALSSRCHHDAVHTAELMIAELNEQADNIYELYKRPNPACQDGSIWKDIVSSPSRLNIQQELKYCIQRSEAS